MWRYIFSSALCVCMLASMGQVTEEDLQELLPKEYPKFAPRFIQFNYNMLRFGENLLDKPQNSQEIQAELGIHKYLIVADMGYSKVTRGSDYFYESNGSFWRMGLDANLSKLWDQGQVIAIGLRYAKATYEDRTEFTRTLANNEVQDFAYANTGLSARWAELVFKMRVKIWKNLSTGYTMRYQFFQVTRGLEESQLQPFDIPGYGRTNRPNSFGFDYYLGWRIDL